MKKTQLDRLAMSILILLSVLWGVNQVAIKFALTGVSPLTQAAIRSAGAALLLMAWMRWRGQGIIVRDGNGLLGCLAGVLFAGEFLFLYAGMEHTTASRSVIFLYTSPFIVAIGSHLFVPGDSLNGRKLLGLTAAFAGVLLAFGGGAGHLTGDTLVLIAAVFWGATTVLVKATRLGDASPEHVLLYQLVVSAPLLAAGAVGTGEAGFTSTAPSILLALAFQTIVIAFASYLTWFWLIRIYPASHAAAFGFLTPFFGVLAGFALLGEPVTLRLAAALVLVASGIYLVTRSSTRAPASQPASRSCVHGTPD